MSDFEIFEHQLKNDNEAFSARILCHAVSHALGFG